jgi:uncharacterized protein YkwD
MKRLVSILFAAALFMSVPLTGVVGAEPYASPAETGLLAPEPIELALLELVNRDRAAAGLSAVELDLSSLSVARQRAQEQIGQAALNHYDSFGQLAFARQLDSSLVSYRLAGENLARAGQITTANLQLVEDALMRSPTHRKNILEPAFDHLAVGVAYDANGAVTFAQIFRAAV